jgi:hypothetical protein
VKSTVQRVLVFLQALRTHPEGFHGRLGPVIGNVLDDGEPGTAMGAIDERVAVSPVFRIEELSPARIAGGNIRRDALKSSLLGNARPDLERSISFWRFVLAMDFFDAG